MPVKIQGPDVARRVAQFFGIRGKYLPQIEQFIVPTISVGDVSMPGVPPVRRHVSVQGYEAAVVAEKASWWMNAPIGVLAVITDIHVIPVGDMNLNVAFWFGGAASLTPRFTDGRLVQPPALPQFPPACTAGSWTAAGVITNIAWTGVAKATQVNHYRPVGWIVGAGTGAGGVQFQSSENNVAVSLTVEWDEYHVD